MCKLHPAKNLAGFFFSPISILKERWLAGQNLDTMRLIQSFNMKKIFSFLKKLEKNNNRTWFNAHRDEYDKAKAEFEEFLAVLIAEIAKFDKSIKYLEPRDTIFRIYRDMRFSPDKRPYKLNFGASIVAGGRKVGKAGYYIHIQPGESGLAGGIYHPDHKALERVRKAIDRDGAAFKKIVTKASFKKYFGTLTGEHLKRAPRDYAEDHPYIEFLKHKDFIAWQKLSDSAVHKKDFAKSAARAFRELKPLDDFLNNAIKGG